MGRKLGGSFKRFARFYAATFIAIVAQLSCSDSTSPVFVPDKSLLARATVVHVDLTTNVATTGANGPAGVSLSLIGTDVVDIVITNLSRTRSGKRDLVRFDLALVNRIPGVELQPPTRAPRPPNGSASVFVFPYMAAVTRGSGDVDASADWDGSPFSFFNDTRCQDKPTSDCFRWEPVPAPILPGARTDPRSVGFLIDRDVKSFDLYMLTATNIAAIPTGALSVTVSSSTLGALAGAEVQVSPSITGATNTQGNANFASLATGTYSVMVAGLPATCVAPAVQNATVSAGATAALTFDVTCTRPAQLAANALSHGFGAEGVGGVTPAVAFTFTNTGGSPSGDVQVTLGGTNASEFTIATNTCAGSLAPTASCTVAIAGIPTSVGTKDAILQATSTQGGSAAVALTMAGIRAAVLDASIASLDAGGIVVGSSATNTVTFRNVGGGVTGILTAALAGADAADFSIGSSSTCGPQLNGGDACLVALTLTATRSGTYDATLTLSGTPGGSIAVALKGRGLIPGSMELTTPPYVLGDIAPGAVQRTFTWKNVGEVPVTVSGPDFGGGPGTSYTVTDNCLGHAIQPAATCDVTIAYQATNAGAFDFSVQGMRISGFVKPAALEMTPGSFDFGNFAMGFPSTKLFTLKNTGLSAAAGLGGVVNGPLTANFVRSASTCGATLAAGQQCTITVTASFVGDVSQPLPVQTTWHITSSTAPAIDVALRGTIAPAPRLVFLENPLFMGSAYLTESVGSSFTLKNVGSFPTGPLTLSSVGMQAGASCPAFLAAGQSCTVGMSIFLSREGEGSPGLIISATPGGPLFVSPTYMLLAPDASITVKFVNPVQVQPLQVLTIPTGGSALRVFEIFKGSSAETNALMGSIAFSLNGDGESFGTVVSDHCTGRTLISNSDPCVLKIQVAHTGSFTMTFTLGTALNVSVPIQVINPP